MTGIVTVIAYASRGVITEVIAGVVGRWLAWLLCYVGGCYRWKCCVLLLQC